MDRLAERLKQINLAERTQELKKWGEQRIHKETEDRIGPIDGDVYQFSTGNYRLVRQIAEGGFAFVFLAQNVATEQHVALKRIFVQDDDHMKSIQQEINLKKIERNSWNCGIYLCSLE